MKYLVRQIWRWEVVAIVATAIFAAAGIGAIYGSQFTLAAVCFALSVSLIVAKTLSWEEVKNHADRAWISLLTVFVGIVVLGISFYWVQSRTSIKKLGDQTAQNGPTLQQQGEAQPPKPPVSSAPPNATFVRKKKATHPLEGSKHLVPVPSSSPSVKQDCLGSNCVAGDNYGTNTVINQVQQPLSINQEQVQGIALGMKAFQGESIDIEEDGMTVETRSLTVGLKRALSDAGLNISGSSAVINMPIAGFRLPDGLTFWVGSDEENTAATLAQLLRSTGVLPLNRRISYMKDGRNPKHFMIGISPTR